VVVASIMKAKSLNTDNDGWVKNLSLEIGIGFIFLDEPYSANHSQEVALVNAMKVFGGRVSPCPL
jgi:hypothetical protein